MALIASELSLRTLLMCLAERPFLCPINVGAFTLVVEKTDHYSLIVCWGCVVNNAHPCCCFAVFYTRSWPPLRSGHQPSAMINQWTEILSDLAGMMAGQSFDSQNVIYLPVCLFLAILKVKDRLNVVFKTYHTSDGEWFRIVTRPDSTNTSTSARHSLLICKMSLSHLQSDDI